MFDKSFRIPKKVKLPGWEITIRELPDNEMSVEGDWEYDPDGVAVIRIKKSLPLPTKRLILAHELQHVLVDYLYMLTDADTTRTAGADRPADPPESNPRGRLEGGPLLQPLVEPT